MRSMLAVGTPEELETLMEDAIVLRDGQALSRLFELGGLLTFSGEPKGRYGRTEIARAVELFSTLSGGYVAAPRQLYQQQDLVLLVGDGVINVARRGRDRSWRFAISLLDPQPSGAGGRSSWRE